MRRILVATAIAGALRAGATAPAAPVVVELFTSEGCSSCPPADAVLARLARDGAAGVPVIALAEHVDFWDDLGWRDVFSSPAFTARQRRYVRALGVASPFTPQAVVDGRVSELGSDERALRAAVVRAAAAPKGEVALSVAGGRGALEVDVNARWGGGSAEVLLLVVQDAAVTRVHAGENAGRTLAHAAVVRAVAPAGQGERAWTGRVRLDASAVEGAGRVVALVQDRASAAVLVAASAALP